MKNIVSFNHSEMNFIKQANNGNQAKEPEVRGALYYTIDLTEKQRLFLDTISGMQGISNSDLCWHAVSFANTLKDGITIDFIRNYSIFITDKKDRTKTTFHKKMSVHEDLKVMQNEFRAKGFRVGLRGVILLCVLKYAEKYLKYDISKYKNFN